MERVFKYFDSYNVILESSDEHGKLLLGDYKSAVNLKTLFKHKINVIINCSKDIPFIVDKYKPETLSKYGIKELELYRIPVDDSLRSEDIYSMVVYYKRIIPYLMKKLVNEKQNILIHCRAGAQRSASIVAVLLFKLIYDGHLKDLGLLADSREKSLQNVFDYIINKRPRVFRFSTKINFLNSIKSFLKLN